MKLLYLESSARCLDFRAQANDSHGQSRSGRQSETTEDKRTDKSSRKNQGRMHLFFERQCRASCTIPPMLSNKKARRPHPFTKLDNVFDNGDL
ncbi:hypothetical protein CEXT_561231 [Caerostris extrusa]|uniref:Uncharacterized protein n=1 Tax=Caerostris extrusa TaxID=172846 RepID=A0AAV4M6D4_CAEEX|nr:hypothetical protein CEXT_561231 [Caerostris extrusa]